MSAEPGAGPKAAVADGDGALLRLQIEAKAERLQEVRAAVAAALAGSSCPPATARDIVLVVDEACQNVIRHAYGDDENGEMVLEIRTEAGTIVVSLRDFAAAADVRRIKPRDLDDVRPGGLGTHFMGQIMDEVSYSAPEGGGNLLRMVKRIG